MAELISSNTYAIPVLMATVLAVGFALAIGFLVSLFGAPETADEDASGGADDFEHRHVRDSAELNELLLASNYSNMLASQISYRAFSQKTGNSYERLATSITKLLPEHTPRKNPPKVIILTGINGVGKTTTMAAMAAHRKAQGQSVIVAACDTFRAAGIDQVEMIAKRHDVGSILPSVGADPAAVLRDAVQSSQAKDGDLVIADTAGRIEVRDDLLAEMQKMVRVASLVIPKADIQVLICLHGGVGRVGIQQIELFSRAVTLDGVVLTNADLSGIGGGILAAARAKSIPIVASVWGEEGDQMADETEASLGQRLARSALLAPQPKRARK